jgi:DNA-binding transcriptional regulator YiaG
MIESYHYTGCGLDYVRLLNGYKVHESPDGRGVSIDNADGLHEAIARCVVASPFRLRGQEVRFLRSMLDLSQDGLARVLGTKRLTVARWEAKPHGLIPGPADRALRLIYARKADGDALMARILDLLAEIDSAEAGETVFAETRGSWKRQAA